MASSKKAITIYFKDQDYDDLHELARRDGDPMTKIVSSLVEDWLQALRERKKEQACAGTQPQYSC